MADRKITELSTLSSPETVDLLAAVDVSAGQTKKITVDSLRTFMLSAITATVASVSAASTALATRMTTAESTLGTQGGTLTQNSAAISSAAAALGLVTDRVSALELTTVVIDNGTAAADRNLDTYITPYTQLVINPGGAVASVLGAPVGSTDPLENAIMSVRPRADGTLEQLLVDSRGYSWRRSYTLEDAANSIVAEYGPWLSTAMEILDLRSDDRDTTPGDLGRILMQDAAGNALLVKTDSGLNFIPSEELVERLRSVIATTTKTITGRTLFEDADGHVLMEKTSSGLNFVPSDELREALSLGGSSVGPANAVYKRTENGELAYGLLTERGLIEEFIGLGNLNLIREGGATLPVMHLITVNGQSLSISWEFINAANAIDISDRDAFIVSGLRRADATHVIADVRGLLSASYDYTWDQTGVESLDWGGSLSNPISTVAAPMAASLNTHRRRVAAPTGTVLTTSHGYSGVPWQLMDDDPATTYNASADTVIWDNMEFWYQQARDAMVTLGIDYAVPWHVMVHGTSQKSVATVGEYYGFLGNYMTDFRAMLAVEGIPGAARLALTQSGGDADTSNPAGDVWLVTMDQLQYCMDGHAVLAAPLYAYEIGDNNVHPDGETTVLFSDAIARAVAEEDSGSRWTTLGPTRVDLVGTTVKIELDTRNDEVLQFHDASKYNGEGIDAFYGFEAVGTTITSVSLTPTTVTIECAGTPTEIRYARQNQDVTGFANNRFTAHRGLLRTSYSWESDWDGSTMYRWVPSFAVTL